jgi:putative ABC transport system permease protein
MNVMFLFEVKQGRDVQEVTFGLEKDFRALGMNTINLRSIIQTMLDLINSIFQLFEVFLGLGLVVGIAGLGIITIRSVVERKREIGIMRAIGFPRSKILASFVTEIMFVATLAVIIGLSIGLVVAYEIFNVMVSGVDVTFTVPWAQIAWIIGITYAASLACTIVPAIRASRIPPAEALRIIE